MIWRQTNAKMMRDPTTVRSNIRLARPQEDRTWLIGIRSIAMQPEMGRTDGSTSQTGSQKNRRNAFTAVAFGAWLWIQPADEPVGLLTGLEQAGSANKL